MSVSVSEIMASYEGQARTLASQGKPTTSHWSGHYNTIDAIISEPDKRWPNEGFHGGQGKKSLTYDELSPQGWRENCLISITYVITH